MLCICTARVGNADRSFSENSGKPEKLGTPIYGPQFRVLSGGSKWLSALPTGGSKWLSTLPTGGSQWHRALPGYLPMKRSYWACLMARTFFSPSFSHCARYSSQVASMSCWPQIQRAMESLM